MSHAGVSAMLYLHVAQEHHHGSVVLVSFQPCAVAQ